MRHNRVGAPGNDRKIEGELLGIISVTDILTKSNFVEQPKSVVLEQEIEKAIAEARAICTEKKEK